MIKPKKISNLQSAIESFGIAISQDQLRKLERMGIVFCSYNPHSKHREYDEKQFNQSVRNVLFYYFSTPLAEIKAGGKVLKDRAEKILVIANNLIQ